MGKKSTKVKIIHKLGVIFHITVIFQREKLFLSFFLSKSLKPKFGEMSKKIIFECNFLTQMY